MRGGKERSEKKDSSFALPLLIISSPLIPEEGTILRSFLSVVKGRETGKMGRRVSRGMRKVAYVASVSVWFRSEERPRKEIFGFDPARNETRTKK